MYKVLPLIGLTDTLTNTFSFYYNYIVEVKVY